jgi:hypothetical protein
MHHKTMHEIAKFASGLVVGDFLSNAWLAYMGYYPINFMGWTFTADMILPALVFDAALFLILVHYGWNIGKIPGFRERTYLMVVGIVFTIVAAAHFIRAFFSADLIIMDWAAPLWLSWVATVVIAYLAYMSFRLAMRMKR